MFSGECNCHFYIKMGARRRFHISANKILKSDCLKFLSILNCCRSNDILNRYSRFQSVGNITLHFPDNFGGDTTQIHYIGLKGEATQVLWMQNMNMFFHCYFWMQNLNPFFLSLLLDSISILCS